MREPHGMREAVASGANPDLLSQAVYSDLHAPGTVGARPMGVALAASMLGHAALLALAIGLARPPVPLATPIVVFPISLVGRPGGGAGGGTGGEPAPAPTPPPTEAAAPQTAPEPVAVAHPTPAPKPKPAPAKRPETSATASRPATPSSATGSIAAPDGAGSGSGGGTGGGSGVGSGTGSGGTSASPGYGTNPEPPYPMAARRLGLEGEVILRVFVAADGRPTDVVVLRSSGHAVLDEAAADTVRTRWRFVPATRGGVPVDDTVQVPIRFRRAAG